jgi:hypothetical protein
LSFGNCDGVFAAIAVLAHSDANVAKDIVAGVSVEGDSVSVDGDPSAWSSLPRDGDVFMDDDAFCDVDHAADFKHNDAIELTNSISERAWTGIVEVCHVDRFAAASPRGHASDAFCAREGERWITLLLSAGEPALQGPT